jgi:hypothetical protein
VAGPTFTVSGGEHDRLEVPVSVAAPEGISDSSVFVVDGQSGNALPAQILDGTLTFIAERLAAGETRSYEVVEHPANDTVALTDDGSEIDVSIGGETFTTFLYSKDHYRPHFYPVMGPDGREVTETGAADHKHHRSLYVAYGEVNEEDCWAEGSNSGRVVLTNLKRVVSGPVFGEIATECIWQGGDGTPLMTDEVTWRIYNMPTRRRVIDATIVFNATEGDVHFGDTKEGGIMCVRVAPTIKASNTGTIENSFGGVNEAETWGKRANWCDYSGYVDETHLGIAVLDHTTNPRHPCHWHVRNYGLMGTNIFGRGTFEQGGQLLDGDGTYDLKAGDSMTFRYQVVVHEGNAGHADIGGAYHNFVSPPKASA